VELEANEKFFYLIIMLSDYLALIVLIGLFLYCAREWWPEGQVRAAVIYFGVMIAVMLIHGTMGDAAPHKNVKRL